MNKHNKSAKKPKIGSTIDPVNSGVKKLVVNGLSTHSNLNQRIVYLYESTIRICLMENIQKLDARKEWQTPLGILLTILIIFPTTEFKDWIFSKYTWQAIFICIGVASAIWLLYTIFMRPKRVTIDQIIAELIPENTEIKKLDK